jgi:hypothetical protein
MKKLPTWIGVALLPLALYAQNPQRESVREVLQTRPITIRTLSSLKVNPTQSEPKMALALGMPAARAVAQPIAMQGPTLAIDKYVVAGGGGSSTGGGFTLDGTIGQAASGGPLSAGSFSLSSGFWEAASNTAVSNKRGGQLTSQ